jgi:hypothetical protein
MPDQDVIATASNGDALPAAAAASPPPPPTPPKPRRPRVPLKQRLWTITMRTYSGALVLGIATVCLMALIYLFRAVFTPATLPPTFSRWQGRLDPAALRQEQVPGVTIQAGRAPMDHYHKVDRWFGSDPKNSCTVSGCHSPLPHPPKVRIAAFLNMHVTFLDCTVCHEASDTGVLDVGWITSATGKPQQPPAVLRLIRTLTDMGSGDDAARKAHVTIIALLTEMDGPAGRDPQLDDLRAQIDSSVPGSPFWRKSVQELARELPQHARGEYGAKIARVHSATDAAGTVKLTQAYLAAPEPSEQRKEIEKQIHQKIVAKPGACFACHVDKGGILNFQAEGYSPDRARVLQTLPLARMIEQIRAGESFQLPKLMEGGDEK